MNRDSVVPILALTVLALVLLFPALSAAAPPEQPIGFSHKVNATD